MFLLHQPSLTAQWAPVGFSVGSLTELQRNESWRQVEILKNQLSMDDGWQANGWLLFVHVDDIGCRSLSLVKISHGSWSKYLGQPGHEEM